MMLDIMTRSKIAITIKDDLLKRLDRAIDGKTIRNRSHAIEYFLDQELFSKAETALLIAGHKDFSCSTLFERKSVLEHHLELLQAHGVKNAILLLHESEQEAQRIAGDGSEYGLRITYLRQGKEQTGTAHALVQAKKFIGEDLFFVFYCHVVAEIDLADFVLYHRETDGIATVALSFTEKPKETEGASRVISAGIFCMGPEIFEYIPKEKAASLERDVFPKLAQEGKLGGYMFEGKWCNVRNQICFPSKRKK
ncbi:MAG: Mannose-1-phosphate guanylyltransferase and mannose-6-phosphate isomerase-related protein [Candidatus Yanofskybacteria bacterium GW2011_GWC1_48_11]|uniref:Mannose-1-phosphate guanylyltransferase and mannose-6-phosphate isomerase-related protein n=1 Tax=Candidatus Yanofskybacteria bacterium GW2011_GWC1_48_11 TaxID=1619027 RepID=A0A837IN47_9BACT|nr:MAG: Mannose-1-phosphate guanylyltransferase and mannose-6-phosphate isomerase-related protein [Candidatus Yanofskybacteria bacterium GW2011_GWC1_48_11]